MGVPAGIIDEELQTKHSKLSQKIEEVISQPEKELQIRLRSENCDIAYPPIIQSGGEYSLKLSVQSAPTPLKYDVIMCGIGARYSMYCANVARTVLVDPSKQQEAEYKALLAAQEAAIAALVTGAPLSAPVDAAIQALKVQPWPACPSQGLNCCLLSVLLQASCSPQGCS